MIILVNGNISKLKMLLNIQIRESKSFSIDLKKLLGHDKMVNKRNIFNEIDFSSVLVHHHLIIFNQGEASITYQGLINFFWSYIISRILFI